MLKLRIRKWNGKCRKHPRYDPAHDGRAAIKGNCAACNTLADVYDKYRELRLMIEDAARNFPQTRERRPKTPEDKQIGLFEQVGA